MFWVKGRIDGKLYTLTWAAGTVAGDELAGYRLRQLAQQKERMGLAVGPATGPLTVKDHLSDPLSALFLIRELFSEQIEESGGEIPQAPELPEGAIA